VWGSGRQLAGTGRSINRWAGGGPERTKVRGCLPLLAPQDPLSRLMLHFVHATAHCPPLHLHVAACRRSKRERIDCLCGATSEEGYVGKPYCLLLVGGR